MFRLRFGLQPAVRTPDGFEFAVANYFALALTACKGLDMKSLYHVLSRGGAARQLYRFGSEEALQRRLENQGVVVQSNAAIHRASELDEAAVEQHYLQHQNKKALW